MTDSDGSGHGAASGQAGAAGLALRLHAEPAALRVVRAEIDGWLRGLWWPDADRDDVVFAVSEACTNAVEHGYSAVPAGEVEVVGGLHAERRERFVVLVVRDWGRWRTAPADSGFRGHGLTLMRECVADLGLRTGTDGTVVTITSCPVPLPGSRSRALLRRAPTGVACPAVDRATGDRRHGRAVLIRRAAEARSRSAAAVADAGAANVRAREILLASERLLARGHALSSL
ncbi:ATP-binding protein [Pseudonocardia xinjiangensis]|uniref:ATP-binding protein n=1 Tax=Pseudonocardia xinjiangensis TaxID=75289 RepID=UPI003D8D4F79